MNSFSFSRVRGIIHIEERLDNRYIAKKATTSRTQHETSPSGKNTPSKKPEDKRLLAQHPTKNDEEM
jgi:hypothetical protein